MPVPALKQHWREKGGGQLRKKERKRRTEIVDTRDPEKIKGVVASYQAALS